MRPLSFLIAAGTILLAGSLAASDRIEIVSETEVGQYWTHAPGVPKVVAGYPSAASDRSQDVCVNIGYLIAPDGQTAEFFEMDSWSSASRGGRPKQKQVEAFVQIAAAAVSRWRFAPVGERPQPVFTSTTFAFDGSKTLSVDAIRQRCAIPNLQAFVDKARMRDRSSTMKSSSYDRMLSANWSCSAQSSACMLSRSDR